MGEERWDAAFAADLHLQPGDRAGLQRARRMLELCRRRTDRLVLLGDVFDVWVSDAMFELAELTEVREALRAAHESGLAVDFLAGNRDFLLTAEDGRRLGMEVRPDEWPLKVGELRLHLLHGDQLLTEDRSYQRYKRAVRSWPVRALARRMPKAWCLRLARRLRSYSDRVVGEKQAGRLAVVDSAVELRVRAGADRVLCGHVHRAFRRRIGHGELLVLPPFMDEGRFVVLREGEFWIATPDGDVEPFPHDEVAGPSGS